jgi:hypothetical protein
MGLWLRCPHCQAKNSLDSRTCLGCGADLRDLPPAQRRYLLDLPAAGAAAPVPETAFETDPAEEEAELWAWSPETLGPKTSRPESEDLSLCEALDRILNKGAVLHGEVIISVADIDLVFLGLQVILASMETARGFRSGQEAGQLAPHLFAEGAYP